MLKSSYVFDIGNSRLKVGEFQNGKLQRVNVFDLSQSQETPFVVDTPSIISSVNKEYELEWVDFGIQPILFDRTCRLPIALDYDTPETLGLDRIAGAAGAWLEFKGNDILLVDVGTCINYDFISSEGSFQGGVISPGIQLRFKSMHSYTSALPDLTQSWKSINAALPGKSTVACMHRGVITGILSEIRGFIQHFKKDSHQMTVILTGGDAEVFESSLGEDIFVRPKIVLEGLNFILEHNVAV